MVVIENMPPPPPAISVQDSAPAPLPFILEAVASKKLSSSAIHTTNAPTISPDYVSVSLPARIPPRCVSENAKEYRLSPFVLLSILKVESNGRTGLIGKNTNGTSDIGPGQFNTNTWGKLLTQKYKIPQEALLNDMCQAIRALSFAVRTEINGVGGDLWRGIGNYHSRTPKHHQKYIRLVHGAYVQMTKTGKF